MARRLGQRLRLAEGRHERRTEEVLLRYKQRRIKQRLSTFDVIDGGKGWETHPAAMTRFTERLTAALLGPLTTDGPAVILGAIVIFIGLTLPKGRVDFSLEQRTRRTAARLHLQRAQGRLRSRRQLLLRGAKETRGPHCEMLRNASRRSRRWSRPSLPSPWSGSKTGRALSMRPLSPSDTDPMARGTVVGTAVTAGRCPHR